MQQYWLYGSKDKSPHHISPNMNNRNNSKLELITSLTVPSLCQCEQLSSFKKKKGHVFYTLLNITTVTCRSVMSSKCTSLYFLLLLSRLKSCRQRYQHYAHCLTFPYGPNTYKKKSPSAACTDGDRLKWMKH